MARTSELVSITAENIDWSASPAQVMLRRTKTSTEALPYQLGPDSSAALRTWLDVSGIASGAVFRSLTKGGRLKAGAMRPRDASDAIKALGQQAKLGVDLTGHSLRVGMAQDMVADNIEGAAIMQAAGWRSPEMLTRYTRKIQAGRGAVARYYAKRRGR
jgi:integrase